MAIINLRKYYYPAYIKDTFIEVPDEIAAALEEGRRIENRQDSKKAIITFTLWMATPA